MRFFVGVSDLFQLSSLVAASTHCQVRMADLDLLFAYDFLSGVELTRLLISGFKKLSANRP